MKKSVLFLASLLSLTSCNPVVDINPLKIKLDEILEYRNNFRFKKFSIITSTYSTYNLRKTYQVSREDEFMSYKTESMDKFGENVKTMNSYWAYREDNEYVVVAKDVLNNLYVDRISTSKISFINLINSVRPTTLLAAVPFFDKIATKIYYGLKDLTKLVNENPNQFLDEYNFTIDESNNTLQINKNDGTKYIYENNFLTYSEFYTKGEIVDSVEKNNMSQTFEITYPELI